MAIWVSVQPPFPYFTDNDGSALEDGYIWLGEENMNPQTNPVAVYLDDAFTQPITQPIRTRSGYPAINGAIVRLYTQVNYSIQVTNKNGSLIYSAPTPTEVYGAISENAADVLYDPAGTGAVQTNVQDKLRETVSVKDFGAVGDGVTDDTSAIGLAIESGKAIYFPSGTYKLSSYTSVRSGQIQMTGADNQINGDGTSIIEFTDDGTGSGVGLNLNSLKHVIIGNLHFQCTGAPDGRTSGGSFIGIQSYSASSSRVWNVYGSRFSGFSDCAIYSESLIGSAFNCSYRKCNSGLKIRSGYFPVSGTTTRFIGGYSSQCNYVLDVDNISQSQWYGCIWEYSKRGIDATSGPGNTVQNCYAEGNSEYGAFWSSQIVLFIQNYSNSAGDTFTSTPSTGSFGFDAIGNTIVERSGIKSRILQMYDRSGNLAESIKASTSNSAYSGFIGIEDSTGTFLGIVPRRIAAQQSGQADRTDMFMVKGTSVLGGPSGWTITNTGTGVWSVTWPSPLTGNTRWPFIFAQGIPANSNAVGAGQIDVIAVIRARDAGGVWNLFNNMDVGFEIRIYVIDPTTGIMTLSNQGAAVQVSW